MRRMSPSRRLFAARPRMHLCPARAAALPAADDKPDGTKETTPKAAPYPPPRRRGNMTLPPGFQRHALRRRARRRAADRLHLRRPRPALGRRVLSLPQVAQGRQAGNDRIVIFEDTDGDGNFDKRTVFFDKGANLSGIELGFGGVWLCSTPNLLFIPDRNGDDKPDGASRRSSSTAGTLEGQAQRLQRPRPGARTAGSTGCNGIQSHSHVGKPGTPDERAHAASTAASGAITRRGRSSRSSPTARPTPGASTSTTTARCSSPTA